MTRRLCLVVVLAGMILVAGLGAPATAQGTTAREHTVRGLPAPTPLRHAKTCSTTNGTPSSPLSKPEVSGLIVTVGRVVIAPEHTRLKAIDWNWGDGTPSRGCRYFRQAHTSAKPGSYKVTATTPFTNGTKLRTHERVIVS